MALGQGAEGSMEEDKVPRVPVPCASSNQVMGPANPGCWTHC